jgi:hypothetical protein
MMKTGAASDGPIPSMVSGIRGRTHCWRRSDGLPFYQIAVTFGLEQDALAG